MSAIDDTLEDLAAEFDVLGDWEERYRYVIELGRHLATPQAARIPEKAAWPMPITASNPSTMSTSRPLLASGRRSQRIDRCDAPRHPRLCAPTDGLRSRTTWASSERQ